MTEKQTTQATNTQLVREVMTPEPVVLDCSETAVAAAERMRDRGVGDVLVQKDGELCGIVTDRDLVLRCVAEGEDPHSYTLEKICSQELATLETGDSVDDAVELMRMRAVRRIPVLEGRKPVGIVSLGDLARARDPMSALGRISAAPASA